MLPEAFEQMRQKHGLEHAKQQRWQGWLYGAFDAKRPAGRRFQPYADYKPTPKVFARVGEEPMEGAGVVEIWEHVGDDKWIGVAALISRDADQAACMAVVKAMFDAKEWPLLDPMPEPKKAEKKKGK